MRCVVFLLLAACRFTHGELSVVDAQTSGDDAATTDAAVDGETIASPNVLHVPSSAAFAGTSPVMFDTSVAHVIDTDALTLDGAMPAAGVTFDHVAQAPSGPELAVLHVASFTVNSTVTVRVLGTRPLIVIASGPITIAGTLDGTAKLNTPGAGGGGPKAGGSPGVDGEHKPNFLDSGGGGGGGATAGGTGGNATGGTTTATGGTGGALTGDSAVTVLTGGSGGGTGLGGPGGTPLICRGPPGAGGAALQLSSAMAVQITGSVLAGGGGGGGGVGDDETNCVNRGSGSGGGSGGSIVLQGPMITVASGSVVAANGGGGGGGGTVGTNGGDGGNGTATGGTRGTDPGVYGSLGGLGGSSIAPTNGAAHTTGDGNGGGGGGAAGRIAVYRTTAGTVTLGGTISPTPFNGTY